MNNKNDWNELEKWNMNRIENEKEKFGFYEEKFKNNKKVDNLVKGLKITGVIFKVIIGIIVTILLISVMAIISVNVSNLKSQVTVDVIKDIEARYKVKINTVHKDVNKEGDGIYRLELKENNNIKFTATKQKNQLKEDLSDNTHKYYFDLWDSENKPYFKINEKYNNEMLEYQTYIEINNKEELKASMEVMNEFINFCGDEKLYLTWDIFLKKGESRIYPYEKSGISNEEATKHAIEIYNNYLNNQK